MAGLDRSEVGLKKLVVGNQDQILIINFDGIRFTIVGRYVQRDWNPAWILFKEPNILYVYGSTPETGHMSPWTKLFFVKPTLTSSLHCARGGAHLEFNRDKTYIVEAGYRTTVVTFWDISAPDNPFKLMRTNTIPGSPSPGWKGHRPHQAVLDPTGYFFIVPNISGDTLLVIRADSLENSNVIKVPVGVGPRHVAFLKNDGITYLAMVSELSNEIFLYRVKYTEHTIELDEINRQSTYNNSPPKDPRIARAAELVVARNQRDVYVSNRVTGDETDHIAHFSFQSEGNVPRLDYVGKVSSGGLKPRHFSLGADDDQEFMFIGNEAGGTGLVALRRDPKTGHLDPTPVATMPIVELAAPGLSAGQIRGPGFVSEI
ncbi:putative isomerase YbhE [Hypoxylon sp. FL1857]|nr:putative isomerase YbhE [Hypoxylon sp. FL1857]